MLGMNAVARVLAMKEVVDVIKSAVSGVSEVFQSAKQTGLAGQPTHKGPEDNIKFEELMTILGQSSSSSQKVIRAFRAYLRVHNPRLDDEFVFVVAKLANDKNHKIVMQYLEGLALLEVNGDYTSIEAHKLREIIVSQVMDNPTRLARFGKKAVSLIQESGAEISDAYESSDLAPLISGLQKSSSDFLERMRNS